MGYGVRRWGGGVGGLVGVLALVAGCALPMSVPGLVTAGPPPGGTAAAAPRVALDAVYRSADGYALSPPAGWTVTAPPPGYQVSVMFRAGAPEPGTTGTFIDNMSVLVVPTDQSLDSVVAQTRQQLPYRGSAAVLIH
jgi:hypothetical protein